MQQVKQSVLIADDLLGQFQAAVTRIAAAAAGTNNEDTSLLRAESERLYAGVWEHLDAAAARTRNAGRATDAYAAVRAGVDTAVGVTDVRTDLVGIEHGYGVDTYTLEAKTSFNNRGISAARAASAALKGAWPDIDWTPPAPMRDVDLRPRGFFARLFGR